MHLTVIAKQPRPGFVKTRLCPPCTPAQAAELAAAALADTLDAVDDLAHRSSIPVRRVLLFDGDPTEWARPGYAVVEQRGHGLGERLANAFDDLGPGIIVGMDTPRAIGSLGPGLDALRRGCDAIGLATDGGYWAIGLHDAGRPGMPSTYSLFEGVEMSGSNTGMAQLARLHAHQRNVHHLAMARDLDIFDDVVAAANHRDQGRLADTARAIVAVIR